MAIKNWSETAASNIESLTGINWDEGMLPSAVNNSARDTLAQIAAMVADVYTGIGPYYADSGSADAYVLTADPAISAYATGQMFAFTTANVNTGASTINVNGVGATAIKVRGNALVGAELTANKLHIVGYNGTDFDLISPADALTDFLRHDGTTAATADLPMGANKITGLADGAAATDAASYGQVILKDGTNAATGNIAMGSNKITGLSNATLVGDAPNAAQVQNGILHGAVGVGTNTITTTMAPVPAAYAAYQQFTVKAAATNTGATTLNVNSLGAKAIQIMGNALVGGEIVASIPFTVVYDGTQFQLLSTSIVARTNNTNAALGVGAVAGAGSVAIGKDADATDANSIAIGNEAQTGTGTEEDIAIGYQALAATTSGYGAVAIGYQAGKSRTIAQSLTAIGYKAGDAVTSGSQNTLIGHGSGGAISTGGANVFVGVSSGYQITTTFSNTGIGHGVNPSPGVSNTVAIGHAAAVTGDDGIAIGSNASAGAGVLAIASASEPLTTSATAGAHSVYLPITINGTAYKISLLAIS